MIDPSIRLNKIINEALQIQCQRINDEVMGSSKFSFLEKKKKNH